MTEGLTGPVHTIITSWKSQDSWGPWDTHSIHQFQSQDLSAREAEGILSILRSKAGDPRRKSLVRVLETKAWTPMSTARAGYALAFEGRHQSPCGYALVGGCPPTLRASPARCTCCNSLETASQTHPQSYQKKISIS